MDQVMENLAGTFLLLQARWESTGFLCRVTHQTSVVMGSPMLMLLKQTEGKDGGR